MMAEVVVAIRSQDSCALKRMLDAEPALARKAQLVVEAGGAASREALELVASRGADVNASWRGYRALHALIQGEPHAEVDPPSRERLACLDWLLAHGADPLRLGAWPPARALLIAAFVGRTEYVEQLLTHTAELDLFAASALGDLARVERLVAREPALVRARDDGGLTALQCAAASRMGNEDPARRKSLLAVAVRLLDAGADPNAHTKTWGHVVDCAYFAVGARRADVLALLFERGADPTAALASAAWKHHETLGELCLEHGADPARADADDRPLLNELVRWGQVLPALWLLAKGADPNRADALGWTALHQAASRGNARMVDALLAAGADPHRRDRAKATPIEIARDKGRKELAARMHAAGRAELGGRMTRR